VQPQGRELLLVVLAYFGLPSPFRTKTISFRNFSRKKEKVAPDVGIEPTTTRLKVERSSD
jgi:hypothetical protein